MLNWPGRSQFSLDLLIYYDLLLLNPKCSLGSISHVKSHVLLPGTLGQHFKGHPVIVTFEAGMAAKNWMEIHGDVNRIAWEFHGDFTAISWDFNWINGV